MYQNGVNFVAKINRVILFAAINFGAPGFILPKAIISYFFYYTTDRGSDSFDLPYPAWYLWIEKFSLRLTFLNMYFNLVNHRFPFNWKNPFGYLIAMCWELLVVFYLVRFLLCLTSYAFEGFYHASSFFKDMCRDLEQLNKIAKARHSKAVILNKFIQFVHTHSTHKKLSIKIIPWNWEYNVIQIKSRRRHYIKCNNTQFKRQIISKKLSSKLLLIYESNFWNILDLRFHLPLMKNAKL